ncbi:hypothetical protein [Nocardioides antri]|uniref:hypothetical protein n=1 Tax=Nocardioides antri TaxID=2607659 RepID=UPI00165EEDDD|nr:hypothetical protein [Nocardioides antri]
MAYAVLMEFDVDLDTHMKLGELIGDAPVKGLIVHAGGPSERGVHSLDVWESKEDSERFFAERLQPAVEQLGLGSGPPLSFQEFDMPYLLRG